LEWQSAILQNNRLIGNFYKPNPKKEGHMKVKKFMLIVGVLFVAFSFIMAAGPVQAEQKTFKWRMQTYASPGAPGFESQKIALDNLKKATGGRLNVKLYGGGTLVGYKDMLEAEGKGNFEMGHNVDAFFAGKDPGFAPIFSAIALWSDPREVRVWIEAFGGKEIMAKAYAKYNVKYIGSTLIGAEPIMSKKPIRSLADFKGLKIRTPGGLTAMLFKKLGASPVGLRGGQIYSALDTNVIDAAEFVTLGENVSMGLHEVTKYVLYPSFHGPIAVVNWGVNMDAWNKLPGDLQAAVLMAVKEADYLYDILSAASDYKALGVIKKKGLVITQLSEADMEKAKVLSLEVALEYSKKSELSAEVINSILNFLRAGGKIK
jgi:TRAP-type mannitol/chloroaromatic compound transport system substrate-binding protein